MKVLKFGGTSVGTTESLRNVRKIVESNAGEKQIVVVSALGGVTDMLIATARQATANDSGYEDKFGVIISRHHKIIDDLVLPGLKENVTAEVERLLGELNNIYKGLWLLRDLSDATLDLVVSYGELLSSTIIAGIIAGFRRFDSRNFIVTKNRWGKHVYDKESSEPLITEVFADWGNDGATVAIVPGFISRDGATGHVTNLGRGGSDYTAAILAATLGAEILEIWTDVDGFMTADPRIITSAYAIDFLTFTEAMELCNFGAKVIYPPTIYPVYRADIPILIKNTFNPRAKGTYISSESDGDYDFAGKLIKGVSSISNVSLVSVSGLGMVGIPGINARIFGALARRGISVFMVSQASSENSTSLGLKDSDAAMAAELLREEFSNELLNGSISEVKITSGLSAIAVVGAQMKQVPGVAGRLFNTLGRNGIQMIACAQGANQTNISFVVTTEVLNKTLHVIHDSFFLSQTQVLNLFIAGTGKVGTSLLRQISEQQQQLLEEKSLEIKVVGIANSRKAIFSENGIDLGDYKRLMDEQGVKMAPGEIERRVIDMNIFNPVFVDCTSNPDIASLYENLLSHNVNVVAANKFSASGSFETYRRLKEIARLRDVKFLFETNVGGGLPIISTLNSLINSGDKILRIEAVLSGTLNYIFDVLSEEVKLARAIEQAKEKGLTEADPRVDLSGSDVVRKIVILAREAGYRIEQEEVDRRSFLPESWFDGTVEEFMRAVEDFEDKFEEIRKAVADKGNQYRYIARYENGKASVGLEEIKPGHPFFSIEASNNIIAITTSRYKEYPLIIKGYGAGAEVTAAGVFADIISIANIR